MSGGSVARAQVEVPVAPEAAFELFVEDIGIWWRRNTPFWNDPERGLSVRIEPRVGGRFIEVYELETGEGLDVGRVTAWEPGRRLALTWTQVGWPADSATDLEIRFDVTDAGTLVRLEHSGFDRVAAARDFLSGYDAGWKEVLGWYAAHVPPDEDDRDTSVRMKRQEDE